MNLYLMAHQDDEFFCLPKIRSDVASDTEILIIYLTSGNGGRASPSERDRETAQVLEKLSVDPDSIIFLGSKLSIPDGQLHMNMHFIYDEIISAIKGKVCCNVYFPCYEGGHQDHDAISWLVSKLFFSSEASCYQFSLYNGYRVRAPFFCVMGNIQTQKKSQYELKFKFSDLMYLFYYKSQLKTWIGLAPFVFFRILLSSKIVLVEFEQSYLNGRPHEGPLLYERRVGLSYNDFSKIMFRFLDVQ